MRSFIITLLLITGCLPTADIERENLRLQQENNELRYMRQALEETALQLVTVQQRACRLARYLFFVFQRLEIKEMLSEAQKLMENNCSIFSGGK